MNNHKFPFLTKFMKGNQSAYSLIEIALSLTIIGIMSTAGLKAIQQWQRYQKKYVTLQHQEEILQAIAMHAVRTGNYPLPADPLAPTTSFGQSRTRIEGAADQKGIVPFITIGISEFTAKDGYGRYFTYVGGSSEERGHICQARPMHQLNVIYKNRQQETISAPINEYNPLVFILISHGENGYGAYEGDMGHLRQKLKGKHGPMEAYNVVQTNNFINAPYSKEVSTYFDDEIVAQYRLSFLKKYADQNCSKPIITDQINHGGEL